VTACRSSSAFSLSQIDLVKVLVADDSAVPRLILERTLQSLGHETLTAVDGIED